MTTPNKEYIVQVTVEAQVPAPDSASAAAEVLRGLGAACRPAARRRLPGVSQDGRGGGFDHLDYANRLSAAGHRAYPVRD